MSNSRNLADLKPAANGVVGTTKGGTGEITRQAAMDALAGAVTSGSYLRGDGTDVVMATIQVADVPTLNQNTTGSSGSCTGNAATATTSTNQSGGTVSATSIAYSTTLTGGTGIVNLGSGQFYKDASGNVGIGTSSPAYPLTLGNNKRIGALNTGGAGVNFAILDGSNNVYLGDFSTNSSNTYLSGASNVIFGTGNSNTERMRIDSSGNVGIGTSSPTSALEVSKASVIGKFKSTSDNSTYLQIEANNGSGSQFYVGQDSSSGGSFGKGAYAAVVWQVGAYPMIFATSNSERARISSAGGFSVGTTSDPGAGAIYATGNITAYFSDDRFKTNLGNIPDALSKVKTLNGFYYEANELAQSYGYEKKLEVGVSAQQVEAVMPEVVAPAPIDENYLTVRYERLVPLLIEAIKELNAKVDALEKTIAEK